MTPQTKHILLAAGIIIAIIIAILLITHKSAPAATATPAQPAQPAQPVDLSALPAQTALPPVMNVIATPPVTPVVTPVATPPAIQVQAPIVTPVTTVSTIQTSPVVPVSTPPAPPVTPVAPSNPVITTNVTAAGVINTALPAATVSGVHSYADAMASGLYTACYCVLPYIGPYNNQKFYFIKTTYDPSAPGVQTTRIFAILTSLLNNTNLVGANTSLVENGYQISRTAATHTLPNGPVIPPTTNIYCPFPSKTAGTGTIFPYQAVNDLNGFLNC